MTTIAYDGKTIAADSRATIGNHISPGNHQKIHELAGGSLYAFCGVVSDGLKMLAFLTDDLDEMPTWKPGRTTAIIVNKKGTLRIYEGTGIWMIQKSKLYAMGSGDAYAYGAMAAGATAAQAVKIASRFDSCTGGTVRTRSRV